MTISNQRLTLSEDVGTPIVGSDKAIAFGWKSGDRFEGVIDMKGDKGDGN